MESKQQKLVEKQIRKQTLEIIKKMDQKEKQEKIQQREENEQQRLLLKQQKNKIKQQEQVLKEEKKKIKQMKTENEKIRISLFSDKQSKPKEIVESESVSLQENEEEMRPNALDDMAFQLDNDQQKYEEGMSDLFGNKEIVELVQEYILEKVKVSLKEIMREAFIKFRY